MQFPVSGVACPLWLPPAAAFLVALAATPAGVSGAFLLLPFQISVLGFVAPAVTPTNLVFNLVSIPGGIYRYTREHRMAWRLVWAILVGTIPGMVAGCIVRVRFLPDPRRVKPFIAGVLIYLAIRLLRRARKTAAVQGSSGSLSLLSLAVGLAGGIYGVGGGAIIAPFAMTSHGLSSKVIAGPALLSTLVNSLVGIGCFVLLGQRPDWLLGLLFGAGGLAGSYCGARLQKHLPERAIRLVLGVLLAWLATTYIKDSL